MDGQMDDQQLQKLTSAFSSGELKTEMEENNVFISSYLETLVTTFSCC
jgi:hypothetical protein